MCKLLPAAVLMPFFFFCALPLDLPYTYSLEEKGKKHATFKRPRRVIVDMQPGCSSALYYALFLPGWNRWESN